MGAVMLRKMMKDKQIATLEELMAIARELDVKMIACTMSMDAMGVSKEELRRRADLRRGRHLHGRRRALARHALHLRRPAHRARARMADAPAKRRPSRASRWGSCCPGSTAARRSCCSTCATRTSTRAGSSSRAGRSRPCTCPYFDFIEDADARDREGAARPRAGGAVRAGRLVRDGGGDARRGGRAARRTSRAA